MEVKKWVLWIHPETRVEIRDDEKWMLHKTDIYLIAYGKQKHEKDVLAKKKNPKAANYYILRKRRMLRYLNYKLALKAVADLEKLVFPLNNGWFKFYFSIPVSWSKKKKNLMEFALCESKIDADNCYKALCDALMPQDRAVSDFRTSKFWSPTKGHIEITVGELPEAIGYTKVFRDDKIK